MLDDRNYDDVTTGSTEIDQDYRDGWVTSFVGRTGYQVTPLTAVFVQASHNLRRFHDASFDSDGDRLVAGLAFWGGRLVRGEISAGYLRQDYDSATLDDLSTWAFGSKLTWQPTPRVTFTLAGNRAADETSFDGGSSRLITDVALRADYELRRNIVLSVFGGWRKDDFEGDRDDRWLTTGAEARYLINRNFSVGLRFDHADFQSSAVDDYERNRVELSGRVQY